MGQVPTEEILTLKLDSSEDVDEVDVSLLSPKKLDFVRQTKKFGTEKPHIRITRPTWGVENIREFNCKESGVGMLTMLTSQEGRRLDDYQLLKTIGKGNFGKVILVKSKVDNNFYALKCLKKSVIMDMKYTGQIKTEKKVLEKIDHPFIIKLHLTFQTPEKLYMLFDYNNGGELFFHLQQKTRFAEDAAKFYAAQLYLALSYLHFNNIIYRDIKPENIILDSMGYIKLIDFGLAKDKFHNDSLTSTLCGTSEYLGKILLTSLAPELVMGNKYGFAFDWWGYGILLHEMLVGAPPFVDDCKAQLFHKIVKEDPSFRYYSDSVKLSRDAKDLINKLLAKNPRDRIKPESIPLHPFFKDISFDDIYKRKVIAPFVPKIVSLCVYI
jgi:serine/threonine protein kinase